MPPQISPPVVNRGPGRQVRIGPTRALGPAWQGIGAAWIPPEPITATTISYVRKTGSDSNGGTSPADAWLTIQHALATVSPGTAIYIGAGTYRETLTISPTPTPQSPLWLIGDVDGTKTGDPGMVQLTAYTTNDKTAAAAVNLINMNGKSNVSLLNLFCVSGNSNFLITAATTSQNVSIKNCAFISGDNSVIGTATIGMTSTFGLPLNWLIDSCRFWGGNTTTIPSGIAVTLAGGANGTDYDSNVTIRNCTFMGYFNQIAIAGSGSTTFRGGNVKISNCFFGLPGNDAIALNATTSVPTTFPVTVMNCIFYSATGASILGRAVGLVVEDYNVFICSAAKSNTIGGQHSVTNTYSPLFHFGQESVWGGTPRPFGEPMQSSPFNAFGSDGKQSPSDLRAGPRPTGITAPAVGALERGNNMAEETSVVAQGYSVTGDGFQDFDIAVDAGAISFSVFCQSDSSYTGQPPQLLVLPNGECGVGSAETCAKLQATATREQLAVTIVPTVSGIVTIRFTSRDQSGLSKVVFDTFAAV